MAIDVAMSGDDRAAGKSFQIPGGRIPIQTPSTAEKLMVFRLRDATTGDFCEGTWIGSAGAQQTLDRYETAVKPLSETHVADRVLPVRWRLQVKIDVETPPAG